MPPEINRPNNQPVKTDNQVEPVSKVTLIHNPFGFGGPRAIHEKTLIVKPLNPLDTPKST